MTRFMILAGATPFHETADVGLLVRKVIMDPINVPFHSNIGATEAAFIEALLSREPATRLGAHGAAEVLAHGFFDA